MKKITKIEENRKGPIGSIDNLEKKDIKTRSLDHNTFSIEKIIFSIIMIFLLWLFFSLTKSVWQTLSNQNRIIKENQERDQLLSEVDDLRKELEYLRSADYLEEVGRNKLGLIKDGEKIMILPEGQTEEINDFRIDEVKSSTREKLVWERWYSFFFYQ